VDFRFAAEDGNDKAYGGTGADQYYYTSGHDLYQEVGTGGTDEIILPSGFISANTVYYKIGPSDLRGSAGHNPMMRQHHWNKGTLRVSRAAANDHGFIAAAMADDLMESIQLHDIMIKDIRAVV